MTGSMSIVEEGARHAGICYRDLLASLAFCAGYVSSYAARLKLTKRIGKVSKFVLLLEVLRGKKTR